MNGQVFDNEPGQRGFFSVEEHDLRGRLRGGASDEEIAGWLKGVVWQKEPRHHIGEPEFVAPPRSMSCIGG